MTSQPTPLPPADPSTPDPQTVVLVAALIRHVLTVLAGLGLYHGVVSDSALQIVAAALVGIAAIGWSLFQKFRSAQAAHQRAQMSAQRGAAVMPRAGS